MRVKEEREKKKRG